ncbi:MAG TPA: arginase [Fimbriimonas sp.]|nr:arginase [Fimbriimonas sp.]
MIEIVGAPFDMGGRRLGSRLGPAALRLADIEAVLSEIGFDTADRGDVKLRKINPKAPGFRGFDSFLGCVTELRRHVSQVLENGNLPLVLCGEHTLSVGGVSAALEKFGAGLAVLWIDAHADIHTPGSSPSGNIHGMPLAALRGLSSETEGVISNQWDRLGLALGAARLEREQISWYALREAEPAEKERLRDSFVVSMHEIDRFGVEETVNRLDHHWRNLKATHVWISFDVDALDPILAPGTGTAVRGGLTYREAHLLAELLREKLDMASCPYRLAGVDVVEVNPLVDTCNETATVAVEWIASLLGKRILG